jgi:hypothetical protein
MSNNKGYFKLFVITQLAYLFVTVVSHFKPNLIFAGKARTHPQKESHYWQCLGARKL